MSRLESFARWTSALRECCRNPLILVFEDLQFADPDTAMLISWIPEALPDAPLLILATHRTWMPQDLQIPLEDILLLGNCLALDINQLSPAETTELVTTISIGDSISGHALHEESRGNPLLILHKLRSAMTDDSKAPNTEADRADMQKRDLVARMTSDLPAETRELLLICSAVGFRFTVDLALSAISQSKQTFTQTLEPAIRARLIVEREGRYEFSHPTLHEALTDCLDTWRRRQIHSRCADHLESHASQSPDSAEELAGHMAHAVPLIGYLAAAQQCSLACKSAIDRVDYNAAIAFAQKAIALANNDADTTPAMRGELLLTLAVCQELTGSRDEARLSLFTAAQIARAEGLPSLLSDCALSFSSTFTSIDVGVYDVRMEALIREAINATPQSSESTHAKLLARLATALQWSKNEPDRESIALESLALAEKCQDPEAKHAALSALAECLHGPERVEERLSLINSLSQLPRRVQDPPTILLQQTRKITALLELGAIDEIRSENQAFREVASQTHSAHNIWYAATTDVMLSMLTGSIAFGSELDLLFNDIRGRANNPNVVQGYAVQKLYSQGEHLRYEDVLPALERVTAEFPLVSSWRAALAWYFWNVDNAESCRVTLDYFSPKVIQQMLRQPGSGAGLAMIAEAMSDFGAEEARRELLGLILPIVNRCAVAGYGVLYFGAFSRYGGILARSLGQTQLAIDLLTRAVLAERSRGALLWQAYSCADLAVAQSLSYDHLKSASNSIAAAQEIARTLRVPRLSQRVSACRKSVDKNLARQRSAAR